MRKTDSVWQSIASQRMAICLFTGFSSGLPYFILFSLVPAWLRDFGISLKTIGLFILITSPYAWKFLWAPLVDRYVPVFMGRRRGWAFAIQLLLLFSIPVMGMLQPTADSIWSIGFLVFVIAFLGASQDIVLDAYRREVLPDKELGLGTSVFVTGYRMAVFVPGSLALILSDHLPWSSVYWIVAGFMLVGLVTSVCMPEPRLNGEPPANLKQAVIEPFLEFFNRNGWQSAIALLAFVVLYKLGDNMATALSTPFYMDLGFSKTEIGSITKVAGVGGAIVGGLIGGVIMYRLGINKSLWVFGLIQMVSILGFAYLSEAGPERIVLFFVVSFEYLGVGMGTVALGALMARATNKRFTATQFALLTSLAAVPRTFLTALTGFMIEAMGYTSFFLFCTIMAIPGMLLLFRIAPWRENKN